ncbi:MAG: DUF3857 domain-containing transglutaminase family protein [bacterium]
MRTGFCRNVMLSLSLLLLALPVYAQLEADRPVPPGNPPPLNVITRINGAGDAKDYPDADHLIVFDDQVNRVTESGVTYVDLYTIYKILTEEGAVSLATLRWNYDPRSSFVGVVSVNIIRDDKRIPVPLDRLLDLPAPQSMIYWNDRIKLLQLPRLQVGDGIEVRAMRKGYNYALLADNAFDSPSAMQKIASPDDNKYIPPMAGEYFDIVLFQADVPIVEKRYTLTLPKSKRLNSEIYNGTLFARTSYTADSTIYSWWTFNQEAAPHEVRQPDESDYVPKVVMTTAESWEAKSRWFWDVNRNQFEVSDAIREKAQQILLNAGVDKGTDIQKAAALNHWVAQNIRYSGQTMGEGEGFTLHPSDMLFEYRSGVCKDIASMSVTFLRAAGLESYPAMTMAGSRIENIPADQFNHCVVALRQRDRFVMLDPTWVPFNNDIWSKLEAEQQYVIGTPKGVKLKEIRYSPPEESPLNITHDATLSNDGTLTGTIRFDAAGAADSRLRRVVYQRPKREIHQYLAEVLSEISNRVEIIDVSYRQVDDFTGNMWLTLRYRVPQYALPVGNGLEFHAPLVNVVRHHMLFFRAGSVTWKQERKTDVFLYYTQKLDIRETIQLPKGYKLPETINAKKVDATYASFNANVSMKKKDILIVTTAEVRRRQIPPSGYNGFRDAIEELNAWGDRVIRVTKGGA